MTHIFAKFLMDNPFNSTQWDFHKQVVKFTSYIASPHIKINKINGDIIYDGLLTPKLLNYFNWEHHYQLVEYTRDPDAAPTCYGLDIKKIKLYKKCYFVVNEERYDTLEEAISNLNWELSNLITLVQTNEDNFYNTYKKKKMKNINYLKNYYIYLNIDLVIVEIHLYLDDSFDETTEYLFPKNLIPKYIENKKKDNKNYIVEKRIYY